MSGTSHRAAAGGGRIFPDSAMLSAQPQLTGYLRRAVNHEFGALLAELRAVAVDGLRHANRELFERMRCDEDKHLREPSLKLKIPGTSGIGGP